MTGVLTLPRWLVRARRRKPRTPSWWIFTALLIYWLVKLFIAIMQGDAILATASALLAVGVRLEMRGQDLDASQRALHDHATSLALQGVGLVLLVTG